MSEQSTTVQPTPQVQATTPQQVVQPTPPALVQQVQQPTVDTNAIVSQAEAKAVEAAEKKMEAVFKSMLEQKGFDTETISQMTAEWKSKQVTPDMKIQELENQLKAERDKNTKYEKTELLKQYHVTDAEDIEVMIIRLDRMVTDQKDFATSAKEYFTAHPRSPTPPAQVLTGLAGNAPMATITEKDQAKQAALSAMGVVTQQPKG